jgi:scyllo-inositol 2-dehydrogenase (NADP+)
MAFAALHGTFHCTSVLRIHFFDMSVNVGILGFGRIGAEHAGWIASAKNVRVMAISDPTPARRAIAESRNLRTVSEIDPLLNDPSLDAILIATPSAMHFEHASKALLAGKHVMIEKPMALDLKQAQELVTLAKYKSKVISVFHNRRWDIDYLTVKKSIQENAFGKLINIESRISQWASCVGPAAKEWRPNWRNESSFGGGGLYDWGSHLIDQMWQLMLPSKPQAVFAQLRGNVWSRDCDDFARVCINFDNGAVGLVEINTTTTQPLPRWHIDGTLGSAEGPTSAKYDTGEWAQLEFRPSDGKTARQLQLAVPGLSESDIWDRFSLAVLNGDEPAVQVETVLTTMEILDAAKRSSDEGILVEICRQT